MARLALQSLSRSCQAAYRHLFTQRYPLPPFPCPAALQKLDKKEAINVVVTGACGQIAYK